MKKLIAILMVLALIAGFAFAETHTVNVSTTVGPVIPSFQLRHGLGTVYTNSGADQNTVSTPVASAQFGAGDHGEVSYEENTSTINLGKDISAESITEDFYAVLAIGGKQDNVSYKLKFTAGAFNTKKNGILVEGGSPCTASAIVAAENIGTYNKVVVPGSAVEADSANNVKAMTITMKGAPALSKIDLVKFTATWQRDPDVDMGTYNADVTLEITVVQ